ncbi:MAG: hypothetical protein QM772_05455 [Ottowia sp.]|uniref:hypothetical protein n=1 Tax=Ottowia sp. TaxID=1898956 RepID=UPI0039E2B3A7
MSHSLAHPIFAALLCGALAPALAQQERRAPPPPPPEAFAACQGKAEGAAVTITLPDGKTLDGTCRTVTTSSGTALAARPNRRPDQPPRPQS